MKPLLDGAKATAQLSTKIWNTALASLGCKFVAHTNRLRKRLPIGLGIKSGCFWSVKGTKTSCFWFAEHMQCDARVDGRGQQSTHASMPRVARRTRIRTRTVRRAARRGRKRKSCWHAYTDVSVERRAPMHVRVCRHSRRPTNIGVGRRTPLR